MLPRMNRFRYASQLALAIAVVITVPSAALAQVKVITSGGFAPAYNAVIHDFERAAHVTVTTTTGPSQGTGPDAIPAQLRRGVRADVVILSTEGLDELIADGKIVRGSDVKLAQALTGLGVRAGASRPDISTVESFKQTLMRAKVIAVPGSTTGIYLTTKVFPKLGIASDTIKMTARGAEATAMVARGDADFAIQPISELHVPGVDLVGPIPASVQFVSVFAAGVVAGTDMAAQAKQLIAFLASPNADAAIKNSGMERIGTRK
jgi:molybdate transport system substrate-binding protein